MPTQGDLVENDLGSTETTETDLGDITVPNTGVSRIVGIYGLACIETSTAGETTVGQFRLDFGTVAGKFKFPAQVTYGAAGTLASNADQASPKIIPVDIPVPPSEVIGCYMTLNQAQTGNCHGQVGVIYE